MKSPIYLIMVLLPFIILSGCSSDEPGDAPIEEEIENKYNGEITPVNLSQTDKEALDNSSDFQYLLFRKASGLADRNENVVISPLSARIALSMIANHVGDNAKKEILQAMAIDNIDNLNTLSHNLITHLPCVDIAATTMSISQSVWHDASLIPNTAFTDNMRSFYCADIFSADFNAPSIATDLNQWCADHTGGLLCSYFNDRPQGKALLLNALHFKSVWGDLMDDVKTKGMVFNGTSGKSVVKAMFINTQAAYDEYATHQVVKIPFGNYDESGGFCLTIVLPAEKVDISMVIDAIDAETITRQRYNTEAVIALPKLSLTSSRMSWGEIFKASGLSSMDMQSTLSLFDDTADGSWNICQGAYISLDESGAEMATVSDSGQLYAVIPTYLELNRPFLFFITEESTGLCLLSAKVMNL